MEDEHHDYIERGFVYRIYDYFSGVLEGIGRRRRLSSEMGFLEKLAKGIVGDYPPK